jgi:triosephosphate isomerase
MSSRTPLIAGNWKMHKTGSQAADAASQLKGLVAAATDVEVMIAPTFTALTRWPRRSKAAISPWGRRTCIGKNRVPSPEKSRRKCWWMPVAATSSSGTRNAASSLARPMKASIGKSGQPSQQPVPVFCIGETEAQREAGETFSVLDKQVRDGLKGFVFDDLAGLVVAYEPVWAIGTGKTATREQAQEAHQFIRSLLDTLFGKPFARFRSHPLRRERQTGQRPGPHGDARC